MKKIALILLALTLTGCANVHMMLAQEEPIQLKPRESLTSKLPELDGPPITIAVYGFADKTGQMKSSDKLALFSKAVTQGAEVFLIKSLQDSKNWFKVVERVGLDNLIKERQLIRNQREVYEGKDAKPLKPMTVAGVMIEGGIIGYDTNIRSGGNGARFLGIGGSQQYRVDEVVISLRLVSVNSGEILLTNAVSKTIYSTAHNVGVLRFVDAGTNALELEHGVALNEPTTYAVRVAIEQAVYEMIVAGEKRGLWKYKDPNKAVIKVEPVKAEETKKDESKEEQKSQTNLSIPPKQATKGTVIEWSNIRKGQSISSERVVSLKPETEVSVIKEDKTHYFVGVNGKEGWIPKKFIKVQNNNNKVPGAKND